MIVVKICGITNLGDALSSVEFGADEIGFNFYRQSKRYIEPFEARNIAQQIPHGVKRIGVFVNETQNRIVETANKVLLDAVQLHGDESAQFICELRGKTSLPIIKAVRIREGLESANLPNFGADAVLLDSYSPAERGGTGKTFDWKTAVEIRGRVSTLYLAGGLTVENVGDAVSEVNPHAVDVCSGVELAPGIKDRAKLRNFIERAKGNDRV
jgi:phosphoribosylanthranilate isomerase